ncbi:MAG: GNAT family N-acetyltransferase [Acidimicrobiales bacterium]
MEDGKSPAPPDIRPVVGRRGRSQFTDVPFRLFAGDPNFVPPLRMSVLDRISPKHPANEHQVSALWMAFREGKPVGRIGACVDRFFNEYQGVAWGWVGFFEMADDPEAAKTLFEVAWSWLKLHGADTAVGPASFTTNDDTGLLVEGFDEPPYFLETANPRYYEKLWVDNGWQPAMDLWGWRYRRGTLGLNERQRRILGRLKERSHLTIRAANIKDFDAEVARLFEVYNAAWSKNWGFAPMPEAEIHHLAKQMKQLIDPELTLIVEKPDGEPVAVSIVLPDVNEVMSKLPSGRLLPFGWYHLLRGVPKVTRVRLFALGIKPDLQALGIGPLLYQEMMDRLLGRTQLVEAQASWILATNDRMNNAIEATGAVRSKVWRVYQRPL